MERWRDMGRRIVLGVLGVQCLGVWGDEELCINKP